MTLDTLGSTNAGRILVVEDEVNIRAGLRDTLNRDGHTVKAVGSAEEGLVVLESFAPEAALVDIRLPGMSGIELLEVVRARWPHTSVIILTGHGSLESAIAAVRAGAHDYLLKPAQVQTIRQTLATALATSRRLREQGRLVESLRMTLNRLDGLQASDQVEDRPVIDDSRLKVGELQIDLRAHQAYWSDVSLSLSPTEFSLLATLASHPGEALGYVSLVRLSLGYEAEFSEAKELIKRHVFALRRKIEPDPTIPRYILNVRGVGYRLASPQILDS